MGIIDDKLANVAQLLKSMKRYDGYKFAVELEKWVTELSYFYNVIVKDGQNPSLIPYKIKPSKRPKEGQMAYINLRRGYPKETFDDHWCYILKDYGTKYIIIPSTSVKEDSSECDERFEIDIEDCTSTGKSRLQISDLRTVDVMRVCQSINPNLCDVKTPRDQIINKVKSVIFS